MSSKYLIPAGTALSLSLSIIAVYRSIPLGLGIDSFSIIFASSSLIVAVLIGFQIVQYITTENKIQSLAYKTAIKAIEPLKQDVRHSQIAYGFISVARSAIAQSEITSAIHFYVMALEEFGFVQDSKQRCNYVSGLAEELLCFVENWKSENRLLVRADELDYLLSLLNTYNSLSITKLRAILVTAEKV